MSLDENAIEIQIQAKGNSAPRLTPEEINNVITGAEYHVFGGVLTVCCITLKNGFMVTGNSAVASPENFDADIGKQISFQNAREQIWALEGYLLKQRLNDATLKW